MIRLQRIARIVAAALAAVLVIPTPAGALSLTRIDAMSFPTSSAGIISGGYKDAQGFNHGFVSRTADSGVTWHAVQIANGFLVRCDASADGTAYIAAEDLKDTAWESSDAVAWVDSPKKLGVAPGRGFAHTGSGAQLVVGPFSAGEFGQPAGISRRANSTLAWLRVFEGPYYGLDASELQIQTRASLEDVDATGGVAYAVGNEFSPGSVADGSTLTYYRPLIYRSTDDGSTWTTASVTGATGGNYVVSVSVVSTDVAYASTAGSRYFLRTTDGVNWTSMLPTRDGEPDNRGITEWNGNAIDALDADNVLLAGTNGKISWTSNAATGLPTFSHYTVQQGGIATKARLTGAKMLDATHWIVTGDDETILRTSDGGATWTGTTMRQPPSVAITAPAPAFDPGPGAVTISGTAGDAGVGVVRVGVTIRRQDGMYWNGIGWQSASCTNTASTANNWDTWSYSWTPSLLTGESVSLIASAYDALGMEKQTASVVSTLATGAPPVEPPPPPDITAPVTVASGYTASSWTSQTVQVRLDSTDGTGTGVDYIRALRGATVLTGTTPLYVPVSSEGTTTVYYSAFDLAGNHEATKSAGPVLVDKTAPTVGVSLSTTYAPGAAIPGFTVSDALSKPALSPLRWRYAPSTLWRSGTPTAPATAGTYTIEYFGLDRVNNASEIASASVRVYVAPPPPPDKVTRLDGANRWVVSEKVARAGWDPSANGTWPGVDHVIIANGEDGKEADPLSAAGLAGVYNAPVLLVRSSLVPRETSRVIASIAAKRKAEGKTLAVHIVGGPASVPDAIWNTIRATPGVSATKDRLTGQDRYQVSAVVADRAVTEAAKRSITIRGALIVAADNPAAFYDALASSPAAFAGHLPMLAVRKAYAPTSVRSVLNARFAGKPRYVVNAPAYVDPLVLTAVGAQPERLSPSAVRYTAAASISAASVAKGWVGPAEVGLAAKLPDSLTGGTFMGKRNGVLLLTDSTVVLQAAPKNYVTARKNLITTGWIFGGTGSVTAEAGTAFFNAYK